MSSPDQSKGSRSRDELLAGEYVLGVLSNEDRQKVEARMRSDRTFAAIVMRWQENLSSFSDEYEAIKPPAGVLPKAKKRVFADRRAGLKLWNSLPIWRGITFVSLFLAAGVLYFSISGERLGPYGKILFADLSASQSPTDLIASYEVSNGRLKIAPVASEQNGKKSLQLWLVKGTDAPLSLGVLPQSGEGEIVVPAALRKQVTDGAILKVSVEPFGGAPGAAPTGPIIASGAARGP